MAHDGLQAPEPAFVSHEKYVKSKPKGCHKKLCDCSYSMANLILIVACLMAIVYALKFILEDDLLYEFAEYLLSLKFYHQLIYIIVILPLILIIPLFDAVSVFFLSGYGKNELGTSLLSVRLCYQIVMGLMIFVGLAFIAPSIKHHSVRSQLEIEIFTHMSSRYRNDFSYQFIDRVQETYECCDTYYYKNHFNSIMPPSCAIRDGSYNNYFNRTCDDVLADIISNRCIIIAICLCAILLALGALIGIDICEMVSTSSERYDINEAKGINHSDHIEQDDMITSVSSLQRTRNSSPYRSPEHDELIQEINNRLRANERERETPLLAESRGIREPDIAGIDDDDWPFTDEPKPGVKGSPILTRANYFHNRPQSPIFVARPAVTTFDISPEPITNNANSNARPSTPTKGVLKKTSSIQKIDTDEEIELEDDTSQMKRDTQTRRSLLNVRFAE